MTRQSTENKEVTSKLFYPALEGFRGVAVVMVLISHFIIIHYAPKLIFLNLGYIGVNFFFVLSGFLITESLLLAIYGNEKSILSNFYMRRTLRIFPIYYLSIGVLFFTLKSEAFNQVLPWALSYTYNIGRLWFGADSIYLSHFWSLCVEEQFYLLWPLLLILVHRRQHIYVFLSAILLSIMIKSIYVSMALPNAGDFILAFTGSSIDALALGGFLAYVKLVHPGHLQKFLKSSWIPLVLLGVFWSILYMAASPTPLFYSVLGRLWTGGIAFFVIGWGAVGNQNTITKLLSGSLIRFIGRISYGLYVYHWIIYMLLHNQFDLYWMSLRHYLGFLAYHKWMFSFLFFSFLSLLISAISFYWIERPLLSLKKRFV